MFAGLYFIHCIGPLGLKANLDENKYLIVLTGDDKTRFLFLAFEGNTRPFTDDEQDELLMIYECITASLHNMAISARGRRLTYLLSLNGY